MWETLLNQYMKEKLGCFTGRPAEDNATMLYLITGGRPFFWVNYRSG